MNLLTIIIFYKVDFNDCVQNILNLLLFDFLKYMN